MLTEKIVEKLDKLDMAIVDLNDIERRYDDFCQFKKEINKRCSGFNLGFLDKDELDDGKNLKIMLVANQNKIRDNIEGKRVYILSTERFENTKYKLRIYKVTS